MAAVPIAPDMIQQKADELADEFERLAKMLRDGEVVGMCYEHRLMFPTVNDKLWITGSSFVTPDDGRVHYSWIRPKEPA